MRENCGFGKAKDMPRVGIGSVPDLVDNGNAFKTMDALRKQEKELRGKIDTMEVSCCCCCCYQYTVIHLGEVGGKSDLQKRWLHLSVGKG